MSDEERRLNLSVADCCATCVRISARAGYPWCEKHAVRVLAYTKCDAFERRMTLPVWVMVGQGERET